MKTKPIAISVGDRFNNLTVIGVCEHKASNGNKIYKCKCICGQLREVQKCNLGRVIGCGCTRSTTYAPRKSTKPRQAKPKQQVKSTTPPAATKKAANSFSTDNCSDDNINSLITSKDASGVREKRNSFIRAKLEAKLDDLREARMLAEFEVSP